MRLPIPLRRVAELLRAMPRRLRRLPRGPLVAFAVSVLLVLLAGVGLFVYYGARVTATMEGRRWSLPTRLYSDVWVVRPGDAIAQDDVKQRLARLRYVEAEPSEGPEPRPGRYRSEPGRLTVFANDRETAYGRAPGALLRLEFAGKRVAAVRRVDDGSSVPFAVFECELIGSSFDEKNEDRTLVRLEEVPKTVVDAIVATEDRDFFSHSGISVKRIVGALLRDLRKGAMVQGGSTLTQQLVKNMFLTHERTMKRKVQEAIMAVVLDFKYTKEEILEAYLNEIYLGQRGSVSVTGVEEASKYYFAKPVSQLDLPEAALLAGVIASPGRFSPFRSPERAKERRTLVLKGMLEVGKIDEAAYMAAVDAPLTRVKKPAPGVDAPHFRDFVLSQVKELPDSMKREDGLAIFTTLDTELQAAAQAAVKKGLEELEKRYKRLRGDSDQKLQAALIALDPATGSVRALVGGRDYSSSQFNRVVLAKRQPGSLFKPFVYLAAFSRRDLSPPITPATRVVDNPISVAWGTKPDETWSPKNYDGEFKGPVTVREALEDSRNIPTVKIAVTPTPEGTLLADVIQCARSAGITSALLPYPSLALGSFEITPMEIAAAYATFGNGGYRVRPTSLLGVVGPNGRRIEVQDRPLARAADADAVAVLDSVLRGVVDRGTAASARRLGAQGILAGKTGTTNDGRDAWFIGFSPRILVAVWVGFDDNRSMNVSGAMAAVPIFADFVRRLPGHLVEAPFPTTPGTVTVAIDPGTGYLVTPECPSSFSELFLAGTEPTQRCPVHGSGPEPTFN